jgi:hypothetical protein
MTGRPGIPNRVWQDVVAAVDTVDRFPAEDEVELTAHLYEHWYLGGGGVSGGASAGLPGPAEANLVDVLRAAHAEAGSWLSGWTVSGVSSKGRVAVSFDGEQRILSRADVLPVDRPCLPLRVGDPVQVVARRDTLDAPGAFWFTYGGSWDEGTPPPALVRVYWHVARDVTPALVRSLTGHLGLERSYTLKVAVEDRDVDRPDRAVLYLGADFADAADAVRAAVADVEDELRDPVPRLAFRLARGVAVAEDPGNGESFGENRCQLLAQSLVHRIGAGSRTERADAALQQFQDAGLDPAHPHLQPGSSEDYRWLLR